jgi:hypothetical protein
MSRRKDAAAFRKSQTYFPRVFTGLPVYFVLACSAFQIIHIPLQSSKA